MKTYKEQVDDAIYSHKMIECGESAVRIQALIEAGEYFIEAINNIYALEEEAKDDIGILEKEIKESITKIKEVVK